MSNGECGDEEPSPPGSCNANTCKEFRASLSLKALRGQTEVKTQILAENHEVSQLFHTAGTLLDHTITNDSKQCSQGTRNSLKTGEIFTEI